MFRHILVPLDGSLQAERALPLAARLVRASDGMLILVRAIAALPKTGTCSSLFQTAVQEEREEAQRYLTRLASSRQVAGLPVIVSVHHGPVVDAIQAAIDTYQTDLIVSCNLVSSPGLPSFFSSLAGRISQRVSLPLLLLPSREVAHRSLAENRQPLTAQVAFAGSQPAPFLIAPAAALLAALTTRMPGHLHFIPGQVVQARLARTSAEKCAGNGEYETADVFVLETPLFREDESFSHLARTYPCLLVPPQARKSEERFSV